MFFGVFTSPSVGRLSRIAAYRPSTNEWTSEGSIKTARQASGVINVGDEYVIIGGWMDTGNKRSEKCHYVGDQLKCNFQNPTEPNS